MSSAGRSQFVYVTYIRTTPEKLWQALTNSEFTKQYWMGVSVESTWKAGSPWKMTQSDGRLTDIGEILEIDPPKRMVIKWLSQYTPEMQAEGHSRCVMELEPMKSAVKLTVTHSIDIAESNLVKAVSNGWPQILSNLKSLLETGAIAYQR